MAKKRIDTALKKPKLDLGNTLKAINMRDIKYYANLTDDERKGYAPLVLMRFMSSAPNQNDLHATMLHYINEVVNQDFWTLSKMPDFQHILLSTCGLGQNIRHEWIAGPKKKKTEGLKNFLKLAHQDMNEQEFKLFLSMNTVEDFKDMAKGHALDDDEIEKLAEQFVYAKNEK